VVVDYNHITSDIIISKKLSEFFLLFLVIIREQKDNSILNSIFCRVLQLVILLSQQIFDFNTIITKPDFIPSMK